MVIGIGDDMKIFIIAFVCVWPVLLNTIDGINGIDPTLKDTARVYGISGRDRLMRITLPAASPQIFAGMRLSLSLALILMVISEMVASTNGIGFFVLQSQRSFAIPEMWSGILLLGILGYVLNLAFMIIERRVLAWHRGARASSLGLREESHMALLEIDGLGKTYGEGESATHAIGDVSFSLDEREFVCVVGPVGVRQDDAAEVHVGPARRRRAARCCCAASASTGRPRRWRSSSRSTRARCCRGCRCAATS